MRVRSTFRLNEKTRPFWNNKAGDGLTLWVEPSKSFELGEAELTYANPTEAETQETRVLEFELSVGETAASGAIELPAYALYYVCENKGGRCLYLRQDFKVKFVADPQAPKIQ